MNVWNVTNKNNYIINETKKLNNNNNNIITESILDRSGIKGNKEETDALLNEQLILFNE